MGGRREGGSKRISDVSLDNCGDRLYFVYTREPRGGLTPIVDILLDRGEPPRTRSRDVFARESRSGKLGNLSFRQEKNIWLQRERG